MVRFNKLMTYLEVAVLIWREKKTTISQIHAKVKINEKTLYLNINTWEKDGYIKTKKVSHDGKKTIYLKICSTHKLNQFIKELRGKLSNDL